jgi:ABC-type branched-subunit amino acid transport system ATPase component
MLEASGIWAHYGPIPAVRDVDLTVAEGEAVVVLGRNGAGKRTLMSVLSGLKRPSTGTGRFDGKDLGRSSAEDRAAAGLVLVPEGRGIFPSLSVRDNLRMGAYTKRRSSRQLAEDIERVTSRFPRLTARMAQRAGSLSGGEAQMLAVARGLMARPRVLMVDEPSLGLAPVMVDELYALLAELRKEGLTLVIVEQYVNIGLHFADRAYVIHKGEVAVTAPTAELVGSPELVEIYMAQGEAGDRDPAGKELAGTRSRSSGHA